MIIRAWLLNSYSTYFFVTLLVDIYIMRIKHKLLIILNTGNIQLEL